MAEAKSILILEDDVELCNSIATTLRKEKYSATPIANLREATFKIKNQKFDLIILDLNLGSGSGLDLIELVHTRKDLLSYKSPILIVSGNLDRDNVLLLAGKVQGALVKPFNMDTLVKNISTIIAEAPNIA